MRTVKIRLYDSRARLLSSFKKPWLKKIKSQYVEGRLVFDLEFCELELDNVEQKKNTREIESWVNREINALEIQKESTLGISQYGEGKLDKLYEVKELVKIK